MNWWQTTIAVISSSGIAAKGWAWYQRRQINRALHIMATVQLRNPTPGRGYHDRRKADGKTSMQAIRALKRQRSDIAYRRMLNHTINTTASTTATKATGPGGHSGTTTDSSAADSNPGTDPSEKSLPGPATDQPTTPLPTPS